jgi:hypothetical protein
MICLGQTTATTKEDQASCAALCGPEDFSGCPLEEGGFWLMKDTCDGYATDASICLNEATSTQCAYTIVKEQEEQEEHTEQTEQTEQDVTHTCMACPPTALCPGGSRMWPKRGYWKEKESDVTTLPLECPPPSKQRCVGWDGSTQTTKCGEGYSQETPLCAACAQGWFFNKFPSSSTTTHRVNANNTKRVAQTAKCQSCQSLSEESDKRKNSHHATTTTTNTNSTTNNINNDTELGMVLVSFGAVVLLLTILVFVVACKMGGDRSTGLARAQAFLFYTLVSLQMIAQIGEQATGFEHPLVLKLYWWLSVLSSVDTSESIPTACMSVPYFWSNFTMAGTLSLLFLWILWTWVPFCRIESVCSRVCGGCCCCCGCQKAMVMDCIRKKVTPQLRRYNCSVLMLLYALVSRTAIDSVHCVTDIVTQEHVQAINPKVVCWEDRHHAINGRLGWATVLLYCLGFPLYCVWLTFRAPWFNHLARIDDQKQRNNVSRKKQSVSSTDTHRAR